MKQISKKIIFTKLFMVLCLISIYAQDKTIDSLKTILKNANQDSIKCKTLVLLIENEADDNIWPNYNTQLIKLCSLKLKQKKLPNIELKLYQIHLAEAIGNNGYLDQLHGKMDNALNNYKQSLSIHKSLNNLKGIAITLGNIGAVYDSEGEINQALKHFKESYEIYVKLNDKEGIATSFNNLGTIYDNLGNIPLALDYYNKCLKLYEELDIKPGIASVLNNIGVIYENQNEIKKALNFYQRALKIREQIHDVKGIALSLNNVGNIYQLEGNLEKAFSVYKKSLELQLQIDDKLGMGYSYINLGDVMKKKGDFKAALNYYEISKKIREEIKDYQGLSQIYLHEGDLFLSNNRKKDAELSYLKGMEIAKKISYPELIRDASEKLYLNYKKIGNNKLAFEYYETFIIMRDSINNIETQKATIKQQTQYEFDKQQAIQKEKHDAEIKLQNEKAEADKKKQNIIIVSVSLVLIIVAVFSLLLYKRFKTTQQQKIIIEKKEKETQAQKHLVEEKQKEILDSINYAKRLQEAILPPLDYINEHLPNNFVLYQPKDVVAGDFYWAEMKDDKFFIAAADCTGHGVPGAMVSVVCSNALNRTVNEFGITNTGNILDKTRELVLETFAKGNAEVKDGMDISLLCIDKKNNKAFWSGANNPLWYVDPVTSSTPHSVTSSEVEKSTAPGLDSARPDNKTFNSIENNITSSTQHSVTSSTPHSVTSSTQHSVTSSEVEKSTASGLDSSRPDIKEIKADKQPIGKTDNPKPFTTHEIELKPGMQFYLFTDGFADQFGGPKGKKFKYKQLEELLLTYSNLTMQEQQQHLFDKFSEWKGDLEQVDDVCVIGVKV